MMKKISIVLAVFNEEENLRACLNSVKDFAWEIVIVDGGSKDKTLEIAKDFHARIIRTGNPQVFHINKNKAIDAAKGDWVLQLDADEIVSGSLARELQEKANKKSDINGYWIPRRNFFLGKYLTKGGQYPDYTLRFYKKGAGRLPARDVHEQAEVSGKTEYLTNDLLHLRDKKFPVYLMRFGRYTDLLSIQFKEANIKVSPVSFLEYMLLRPLFWFLRVYIRHKGFIDGFPGLVFALFSALRFPVAFCKLWKLYGKTDR